MAQTNYTPISLYYSTTASAVPTAANLVQGELAINTADGKLYYEDSSGVVQVLATKSTGSIGGSNTQVQFNNSGSLGGSSGLTWDGSFLTTSSIKNSALTSGRVTYAGASGLLSDNANFVFNGTGLGVGTASPDALLDVTRSGNGQIAVLQTTATRGFSFESSSDTAIQIASIQASTNLDLFANTLSFSAGGSERMRITSAGNVGIGTSSPDSYATGAKNLVIASSGDSGMTIRSGTTSTGVISFANAENSTSNNGIFEFNHNDLAMNFNIYGTGRSYRFKSAGTEVLYIDASGNLGLGVTPSAWGTSSVVFKAIEIGVAGSGISGLSSPAIPDTEITTNAYYNSGWKYAVSSYPSLRASLNGDVSGAFTWNQAPSGTAGGAISFTQAMTLDASGNLLVGTTTTGAYADGKITVDTSGTGAAFKTSTVGAAATINWNSATSGDNQFVFFVTETSPTLRGNIAYNRAGGLVAYNVTSDYRAKDIIGSVTNSGEVIDSVPVYMGKMKDATQERPMFIAHETPSYAHTGEKDAVDVDGNPVYQQMDASTLIPVMWAEIQSLRQRIKTLENK